MLFVLLSETRTHRVHEPSINYDAPDDTDCFYCVRARTRLNVLIYWFTRSVSVRKQATVFIPLHCDTDTHYPPCLDLSAERNGNAPT